MKLTQYEIELACAAKYGHALDGYKITWLPHEPGVTYDGTISGDSVKSMEGACPPMPDMVKLKTEYVVPPPLWLPFNDSVKVDEDDTVVIQTEPTLSVFKFIYGKGEKIGRLEEWVKLYDVFCNTKLLGKKDICFNIEIKVDEMTFTATNTMLMNIEFKDDGSAEVDLMCDIWKWNF